ncbi:hypothetical protein [Arthrobacter sp. efr-133-R2A-120]|uniref:hypothetical protein n=1 Tax=Arthrobacter sp. efr-133-R2A-120 TaxID=3040277 RepID=UPI00254E64C2|nr:hypothetical protein [Arthrobacter sp. efr-133-R2A-120]
MDIEDVLRKVRDGLDNGDFALPYLWVMFRAKGGGAGRADLDAVLHGQHALSDNDALVLGSVLEQLNNA